MKMSTMDTPPETVYAALLNSPIGIHVVGEPEVLNSVEEVAYGSVMMTGEVFSLKVFFHDVICSKQGYIRTQS